jgi:hypothetical protein
MKLTGRASRGVEVRNFLLRGEAGHVAAVRPGLEPLPIGVERRVTLGNSEGLIELCGSRGGKPRGFVEQGRDRGGWRQGRQSWLLRPLLS